MVALGGVLSLVLGTLEAVEGAVMILWDEYHLAAWDGSLLATDYTNWGGIHLFVGGLVALTGFGLFAGQRWARVGGSGIAGIGALVNLAFLPANVIWCTIVIGSDLLVIYAVSSCAAVIGADALVIYALAAHGRDARVRA